MRAALYHSPVLQLVTASALWGGATVLNKVLLASIAPVALLVVQLAASTFALACVVLVFGIRRPDTSLLLPLALLGVLNPGIAYTLNLIGLVHVTASVTTLLWAAEPILIAVIAFALLREPITISLACVLALGGVGVLLVTNAVSGFGTASNTPSGILLLLSSVVCCAFYSVISRKFSNAADPVFIVAIQQAAGLIWAVALLLCGTSYGSVHDIGSVPLHLILASALSGLMYYAAAYGLFLSALRHVPAGIAGSYFNLIPLFGVALAYFLLGERLATAQWLGAAAIVLSALGLVRLTGEARTPA